MHGSIVDPEAQILARAAVSLEEEYATQTNAWAGSPFAWIKGQASRRVGKIGEQLVTNYFISRDLDVTRASNSEYDRKIEGLRAEIKFSMVWENDVFVFQQIRDQHYDVVIALGLFPFDVRCWVVPKDVLLDCPEGVTPQHGGSAGRDTLWLRFDARSPPSWMTEWGGNLSKAREVLIKLAAHNPSGR